MKPGEDPAGQQLYGKKRGGALTVYVSEGLASSYDPGQSWDDPVVLATQRPLFAYATQSYARVIPDMAAFMPTTSNGGISDGGRTLTVHIRTNVHFSPPVDRAVTSADISYAIERGANPNVANGYFAVYFGSQAPARLEGAQSPNYHGGSIPGIQTPSRSTIVFHMTEPVATTLIHLLTLPLSAPVPESFAGPLDRHDPTPYGSVYLVATGPYMVKSNTAGRIAGIGLQLGKSLTLVRNPNWKASTDFRPAYVNEINVVTSNSSVAASEQVLKGSDAVELDDHAPSDAIVEQAYRSYPSQITFTLGGSGENYLSLDNAAGPFRNVNVRRAIWAALDRRAIVQAHGGPFRALPATHFIYPGVIGYEQAGGAAGPRVDYNVNLNGNLRLAEKYMRLAGYPTGKYTDKAAIQIVGVDSYDWPAVTQIVNRTFTSLGFHTHVIEVGFVQMYTDFCDVPRREVDACTSVGWVRDSADPLSVLFETFYGPSIRTAYGSNWSQVNDPRINAAIARAALVYDPVARAQAWARVDRLLVDRAVAVPLTFNIGPEIESGNVAGVNAIWNGGAWDLDFTSLK